MPTCPACGVSLCYDELRAHLGTCRFVWSEAPRRTDSLTRNLAADVRRLEERLAAADTHVNADRTDDDATR